MLIGPSAPNERHLQLTAGDIIAIDGVCHCVVGEVTTGYMVENLTTLSSETFDHNRLDALLRTGRLKLDERQRAPAEVSTRHPRPGVTTPHAVRGERAYTVRRRSQTSQALDATFQINPQPAITRSGAGTRESARPEQKTSPSKSPWQKLPDLIRGTEVRKIRRRGYTGYTGDVPMTRLRGKVLSAESLLEVDFLIVTDAHDDDIVEMTAQPLTLNIVLGGKPRPWTPDYKIVRRTGVRELVEVKPLSKLRPDDPIEWAKVTARLDACRLAARAAGYTFRLVTEQEIRVQPLLYNAKLIHRHMHGFGDHRAIIKAVLILPSLSPTASVAALGQVLDEPASALALAIRLDRLGHIRLDRRVQFSRATTFTVLPPGAGGQP